MNFYNLNRGLNKRLHRYFSYQSTKVQYRSKIRKIIKEQNIPDLTKDQKKQIASYYASYGFKNICTDWHRYYTYKTGNFFVEYIPEDFFYNVIEPSLNMKMMFPSLTDKNLLDRLFRGVKQPDTLVKNINGFFFNSSNEILNEKDVIDICLQNKNIVIKPSIDSGGGKNVLVLKVNNNTEEVTELSEVLRRFSQNFIIQAFLEQHPGMSLLSETSVNTLRIKTILMEDKVQPLYSVVRMSNNGASIDNIANGGIFCGIDENGKLIKNAYNGNNIKFESNNNGIIFEGYEVPNFNEAIKTVKRLHLQVPYFKMVSWDIAIDHSGSPVLIEYNVIGQGYGEMRGPMFGKYTSQVLGMSKRKLFEW